MPLSDHERAVTREELRQLAAALGQQSSEMRSELTVELHELRRDLSRFGHCLRREVHQSVEHATDRTRTEFDLAQSKHDARVDEFSDHVRAIGSGVESRLIITIMMATVASVVIMIGAIVYLVR